MTKADRARQQRQTHKRRKDDVAVKRPIIVRPNWMEEERKKRLARDPWRGAQLGPGMAAAAALLLGARLPDDQS